MSFDQIAAFALLGATVVGFVWNRLPYDLVALLSLGAGLVLGLVPADQAFSGFGDEVVILIASALVISAAVSRSGVVEALIRPIAPYLTTSARQVPALSAACMVLSMATKNVGALAIFMPVALQLCRRHRTPPSAVLMPMSVASMLGGIVTLVGTSPNLLVAKVRADIVGRPFGLFSFTPVGLTIALAGLAFVSVGWRLLPRRRPSAGLEAAFTIEQYTVEAHLDEGSSSVGRPVAAVEALAEGDVNVGMVIRERFRRLPPRPELALRAGDTLMLRGEPADLDRLVARAQLRLEGALPGEAQVVEGVVTAESALVGQTLLQAQLEERFRIGVLAVSRSGQRIERRLGSVRLHAGDVVVLRSPSPHLADTLGELRILPLAHRGISLGQDGRSLWPALVLAVAMVLVGAHVLNVAVAFFLAAVAMLLLRTMSMHDAYQAVEWNVVIMIAALIPVTGALERTGDTQILAQLLTHAVQGMSGVWALGLVLVLTLAITPFLANAPTVLIMGPIAAKVAGGLGYSVDPFLMAVAIGAASDFLTPVGHQCNTLVMGPGGYRFGDYSRLGAPLTAMVIVIGLPMLLWIWPLHP